MAVTFIPNPEYRDVNKPTQPSEAQREALLQAANCIFSGFVWYDSAEGFDFWRAVHDRLINIGHGEELR